MAREMNVKTYGIPGLINQLKSGQINRKAEMQRSYVWGNKEQTEFIDSVFQSSNTYIPPLIGAESENEIEVKGKVEKVINLLDGVQRSTTLDKFLNNEIKLGYNILPVKIDDESEQTYNVAGLKFEELPDVVKTFFKLQKIQMIFFKNMSYTEQERQFIKLQGGKKLSNAEVNKVRIGQQVREFIYKQLATDLWTKYANISSNREVKFETMQQVLMIMNNKYDLSGKSLQAFSEDSEMITEDTLEQAETVTQYLNEVAKLIKKLSLPEELQSLTEAEIIEKLETKQVKKYLKAIAYFKKVNVPIIYNNALKAIQNGVTAEQYANFISKFFVDISAKYKRCTESKSADSVNVKGRIEELDNALVKEFEIVEKEMGKEQQFENLESDITPTTSGTSEESGESGEFREEAEAILNIALGQAS
jgi:hypothetical protein